MIARFAAVGAAIAAGMQHSSQGRMDTVGGNSWFVDGQHAMFIDGKTLLYNSIQKGDVTREDNAKVPSSKHPFANFHKSPRPPKSAGQTPDPQADNEQAL